MAFRQHAGVGNMTEYIQVSIVQGWITRLQDLLKAEIDEGKTDIDFKVNLGMRHGLDQVTSRLDTWLGHQKYGQTLRRLGRDFLMVRRVNLSDGRYRKLEWYQGDFFLVLAWRHGKNEETGDLSKTYLVYQGGSSYDDLARLARVGGMEAVRKEGNQQEWMEKVWT